jgi:proteasome accessory factor A
VHELPWDDARLAAADVQWSQLGSGLAARLERAGAVETLTTAEEVLAAMTTAPRDTRARLRGDMVAARPEILDAAGWSSVVLDRETEHGELEVVHLDDPLVTSHPLLDALIAG